MPLCLLLISGALTATGSTHGPIRLSGVAYLGDLPTLVAVEQGMFQCHGLEIETTRRASGKQNLQALRNGEADIALMATTPLVLDLLKRPPRGAASDPLIIATLVYSSRLNHVVTLDSNDITTPSDLAGRRIGLMKGTNAEFLWWLFSALHRIDTGTGSVIDMPVAQLPEALVTRDIDAAVIWEPWTSRLKDRLGSELILLPGSDIYIEHWVLVTTRGLLQQHPDDIRDILATYRDAIAFIEASPDQAFDLYSEHAGLEAKGALRGQDLPLFGLSLDWSLLTALMETVHWAHESADVKLGRPPNPLSWIEPGPLREIMPFAVGLPALPANGRADSP